MRPYFVVRTRYSYTVQLYSGRLEYTKKKEEEAYGTTNTQILMIDKRSIKKQIQSTVFSGIGYPRAPPPGLPEGSLRAKGFRPCTPRHAWAAVPLALRALRANRTPTK